MIFFQEKIAPFRPNGYGEKHLINPNKCDLVDGRNGYFLADDKKDLIEAKGATVEHITKDQIKQDELT